jgi:hypothetical protein
MNANKDKKQQIYSAPTSSSTPGFHKTNFTSGPSYYPEDDEEQQLAARRLEQESAVSNERAAAKSRNEKADAKLKQEGKAKQQTTSTDEKLKRAARSDRHQDRRERMVARTTGEVTKPPTKTTTTDVMSIADEKLEKRAARSDRQENRRERMVARTTGEVTKPPTKSVPPSQEVEQDYEDKDEDNPGAVWVSGEYSMYSAPAVQEGEFAMEREDSTSSRMDGSQKAMSSHMILEAKLVAEEDTEGPMGQVAHAEIVKDDGSRSRRRAVLCAAIVGILSAIILGILLGKKDNTSPDTITRVTVFYLQQYQVSGQALQDPFSSQSRALAWMAHNDSIDLQSTMSDDELAERFAVVNFYFATGGRTWLDQAGFLSPLNNTCSWNSILDGTTRVLGVGCNEEGSVSMLDLCKIPKSSTC